MGLDLADFVRKTTPVKLGGKEYIFTEITLDDMALFRQRVREQREKTRAERRKRLLEDAKAIDNVVPLELLKMLDEPPSEDEYQAAMDTVEGSVYLAYLSLRHKYPEISEHDVGNMITPTALESDIVYAMFPGARNDMPQKEASRTTSKKK